MIFTVEEAARLANVGADDPDFQQVCAAVDRSLKEMFSRQFEYGEFTERPYIEGPSAYGTVFYLAEYPIDTIDELRIDYNGQFGDDTIVNSALLAYSRASMHPNSWSGRVELRYGYAYSGTNMIQVKYHAGFHPAGEGGTPKMPEDLRRVAMRIAAIMQEQGGKETMQNEHIGNYSYSRYAELCSPGDMAVLNSYIRQG